VHLFSEDGKFLLHRVYIANTRERPDAVTYQGQVYLVRSTLYNPPHYYQIMKLEAFDQLPEMKDETT
jgi:hypothetical protein